MKTITKITRQQRKEDRLNIFLDGGYAFSLHVSIAAPLQVGQTLSEEECQRLVARDAAQQAYEQALHYLKYRPRSAAEVASYLRDKKVTDEAIQDVLARLRERRWVDDAAFAAFWVENRELFRPRSRHALRAELRQKGISDQVIEASLEDVDELASAYEAAKGRAARLARLDYQTFRRRLGGFLQRRGFGYEEIKETVERLWREYGSERDGARHE